MSDPQDGGVWFGVPVKVYVYGKMNLTQRMGRLVNWIALLIMLLFKVTRVSSPTTDHRIQGENISPIRVEQPADLCESAWNKHILCFICSRILVLMLCFLMRLKGSMHRFQVCICHQLASHRRFLDRVVEFHHNHCNQVPNCRFVPAPYTFGVWRFPTMLQLWFSATWSND